MEAQKVLNLQTVRKYTKLINESDTIKELLEHDILELSEEIIKSYKPNDMPLTNEVIAGISDRLFEIQKTYNEIDKAGMRLVVKRSNIMLDTRCPEICINYATYKVCKAKHEKDIKACNSCLFFEIKSDDDLNKIMGV